MIARTRRTVPAMRAGESVRRVVSLSRRVVASGRRGVMSVVRRAVRVVRRWVSGLVAERRSGGRRSVVGEGGLVGGFGFGGLGWGLGEGWEGVLGRKYLLCSPVPSSVGRPSFRFFVCLPARARCFGLLWEV
jgi:hypothetical protein